MSENQPDFKELSRESLEVLALTGQRFVDYVESLADFCDTLEFQIEEPWSLEDEFIVVKLKMKKWCILNAFLNGAMDLIGDTVTSDAEALNGITSSEIGE